MAQGIGSAGYKGKSYLSSDGGSTYIVTTGLNEMGLDLEHEPIETTNFDSTNGFKEYITGLKGVSGSMKAVYVDANSSHEAVFTATSAGSMIKIKFRPIDLSGKYEWIFDAFIKKSGLSQSTGDAVALSIDYVVSGEPTHSLIP